jgi:chaperonin cofactor prefoldin
MELEKIACRIEPTNVTPTDLNVGNLLVTSAKQVATAKLKRSLSVLGVLFSRENERFGLF